MEFQWLKSAAIILLLKNFGEICVISFVDFSFYFYNATEIALHIIHKVSITGIPVMILENTKKKQYLRYKSLWAIYRGRIFHSMATYIEKFSNRSVILQKIFFHIQNDEVLYLLSVIPRKLIDEVQNHEAKRLEIIFRPNCSHYFLWCSRLIIHHSYLCFTFFRPLFNQWFKVWKRGDEIKLWSLLHRNSKNHTK